MKKVVIILIAVLLGAYIVLAFLSSDNEYKAEKLFYNVSMLQRQIKLNPDATPPAQIASVKSDLENIIKKYPETNTAGMSHVVLAEIYASEENYDASIRTLDKLVSSGSENRLLLARAHFLKGLMYIKEKNLNKAFVEFKLVRDEYFDTPLGLQMPFYMAQLYANEGKAVVAKDAFEKAVAYYKKIQRENSETMLGYSSANLLIQTYLALNDYESAGRVVEDVIRDYPLNVTLIQQLPYVDLIFVKTLNRPEKAIEVYSYVIGKSDNDRLNKALTEEIKKLKDAQ